MLLAGIDLGSSDGCNGADHLLWTGFASGNIARVGGWATSSCPSRVHFKKAECSGCWMLMALEWLPPPPQSPLYQLHLTALPK